MSAPFRIAIAGLGTVGAGTAKLLQQNAELIAARCGRALKVEAVSARNQKVDRGLNMLGIRWVGDPLALAADPDIDVVVELIGGADGIAKQLCETALKNGKHVITANKALIAHHGLALAALAEKTGKTLAFEAAVAGGIPIIQAMRDGLAANRFSRVAGILNGTCNYVLTLMREQKKEFAAALSEAQRLGYAEADPSFDIDGVDTAHKLAILAALAYGAPPDIASVHVEGIRNVTARDVEFAAELGYRIKLLGIAEMTERGLMQRVHPCMVAEDSPLGAVHGVYNGVEIEGDGIGTMMFEGRGAGAGPTASSVIADIIDIARGLSYNPFTLPASALTKPATAPVESLVSQYYLRLGVIDKPGVLAEVTGIFREEAISLRSFLQHSHQLGAAVQVVLTTHATAEAGMRRALNKIQALDSIVEPAQMIRIENL